MKRINVSTVLLACRFLAHSSFLLVVIACCSHVNNTNAFSQLVTDDNWLEFIYSSSTELNIQENTEQLNGIFLSPLNKDNLYLKEPYRFNLDKITELTINNEYNEANSYTVGINLAPSVTIYNQISNNVESNVILNTANDTTLSVSAQQGQSIGINAELALSLVLPEDHDIEYSMQLDQQIDLGEYNIVKIENAAGHASALNINNLITLPIYAESISPRLIAQPITTNTNVTIGNNTELNANADQNADGIIINNKLDVQGSLFHISDDGQNGRLTSTMATNLGQQTKITATATHGNAQAVSYLNDFLFNVDDDGTMNQPPPNFKNLQQKSVFTVAQTSQLNAIALQGNATGLTLTNRQTFVFTQDGIHNVSIGGNNNFIIQAKLEDNVDVIAQAAQTAVGIQLKNEFTNTSIADLEFKGNTDTLTKLIVGQDNYISAHSLSALTDIRADSYAIQLINHSELLSTDAIGHYSAITNVSAQAVIDEKSQLVSQSDTNNSYGLFLDNQVEKGNKDLPVVANHTANIDVRINDGVKITSLAKKEAYGIYLLATNDTRSDDSVAVSDTTVNLIGNLTISSTSLTGEDDAYALYLKGNGTQVISKNKGNYQFTGDIQAHDKAIIDLKADADSFLKGNLYADNASIAMQLSDNSLLQSQAQVVNNGSIELILNNNAYWQVQGASNISSLFVDKTARVDISQLTSIPNTMRQTVSFNKLTTDKLSGNGLFYMNADLDNASKDTQHIDEQTTYKDFLHITQQLSGQHTITMTNRADYQGDATGIILVRSDDPNSAGDFTLGDNVEFGGTLYALQSIPTPANTTCGNGTACTYWGLVSTRKPTTTVKGAVSSFNAGYLLTYAETQSTLQRMGQLRNNRKYQGDLWLHGFSGGMNAFEGSPMLEGFHMTYNGIQIGSDRRIIRDHWVNYAGVLGGLSTADFTQRFGSGSLRNWHVGVYNTLVFNNQMYIDFLAKYTRMSHRYDLLDSQRQSVFNKTKTDGVVSALSVGQQINIYDWARIPGMETLYIEPQAQLSIGYNGSSSYRASNGLHVSVDDYLSTLGKLSISLGHQRTNSKTPLNGYVTFAYLNEMGAKTDYKFNHQENTQKFTGSWYTLSIGVSTELFNQHTLFLDMEHSEGNRFNAYKLNAGYRFSF